MPLDYMGHFPGRPDHQPSHNVLGGPLQAYSIVPLASFFWDGCCDIGPQDHGSHTVCAW